MGGRNMINLGIIGCGAISEGYLKILCKKDMRLVAAVDKDEGVAKKVKEKYRFEMYALDYKNTFELVDSVIVCLPNFLHSQVSIDFLKHGINVLSEKPMAMNEREARMMVSTADETKSLLSVANVKRFYWSSKEVKRLISTRSMGEVVSVDAEEGSIFSWPTKSGFFFEKKKSGGGVVIDVGSHLLDLILWWIGGYPNHVAYIDDNFGGVEADAEIELFFNNNKSVSVKLSRIRDLNNTCKINLTRGVIIVWPDEYNKILLIGENGEKKVIKAPKWHSFEWYFESMIDDFLSSVSEGKSSFIDPKDVLPSIRLIEQCYSIERRFKFLWL